MKTRFLSKPRVLYLYLSLGVSLMLMMILFLNYLEILPFSFALLITLSLLLSLLQITYLLFGTSQNEHWAVSVLDNHNQMVCRALPDTTRIYVNKAYCQYFSIEKDQLLGTKFIDMLPPDARTGLMEHFNQVKMQSKAISYEHQVFFNEQVRWTRWTTYPIYNQAQELVAFQAMGEDITQERERRLKIERQEEKLREALEIAQLGTWELFYDSNLYFWDRRQREIFGFDEQEEVTLEKFLRLLHPDDREDIEQKRLQTLQNLHLKTSDSQERSYRIINSKHETIKYILSRQRHVHKDGRIIGLMGVSLDITQSKQMESELEEKNRFIEGITQTLPGLLFLFDIQEFELKYINQDALVDLTSPEEFAALGREGFIHLIHPEDQEKVLLFLSQLSTDSDAIQHLLYRVKDRNDKYRWLQTYVRPHLRDQHQKVKEVVGIGLEVTDKQVIAEELSQKNQILESLIDNLPIGLQIYNEEGYCTLINKKMSDMLGFADSRPVIGRFNVLTDPFTKHTGIVHHYQKAYQGETVFLNNRIVKFNTRDNLWPTAGEEIILNIVLYPIFDKKGKPYQVVGLYEDVTEEYYQEKELASKQISLELAQQEAEKALRVKEEFLSNMNHEIRNPLNNIVGLINLLLDESPQPHQIQYMESLKFSANHLLELVNNLLDYSKIEAGEAKVQKQVFSLPLLCQALIRSFQAQASQKGLSLGLILEDRLANLQVQSDKVMIYQILSNLLGNALKFTQVGGVQLRIVSQAESPAQITLRFEVEDSGSGIPEDQLAHIFERFTQVSSSEQIKPQGTGLGLSICRALLHLLGSQLEVSSEVGQGSTFFFQLTLEKPQGGPISKSISPQEASLSPKTILVAEDNLINQQIVKKFLNRWGYEVEVVDDGQKALDLLQKKSIDLVLTDIQMPKMDGLEVIKQIKAQSKLKEIPMLVMSAEITPWTQKKLRELGMLPRHFITKPFDPSHLQNEIQQALLTKKEANVVTSLPLGGSRLESIANGDLGFIREMKQEFRKDTEAFIQKYENYLLQRDQAKLSSLIHHYATSLALFELEQFKEDLTQGKALLLEQADVNTIQSHLHQVKNKIQALVEQLS